MKVSVVLIAFNQEQYIARAIHGVLAQQSEYTFELLISDDCSSDRTPEIIAEYASRYPEIIVPYYQPVNIGPKNNDRFLFQKAKGEYICYCEADDFWNDPKKMQKQVSFLETNPDFGLVHSDIHLLDEATGVQINDYNKSKGIQIVSGHIEEQLLVSNHYIKTMTVCYRKQIIESFYFTDPQIAEANWTMVDLSQWLCIAYHSKVHYFDEVMATYCLRPESMSKSRSPLKMHHFHRDIYNIRFHFIAKYGCSESILKIVQTMYASMLIGDAYKLGNRSILLEGIRYAISNRRLLSWKEWGKMPLTLFKSLYVKI
jgi:glycosyltransferase involved in cell wall biosynthesis